MCLSQNMYIIFHFNWITMVVKSDIMHFYFFFWGGHSNVNLIYEILLDHPGTVNITWLLTDNYYSGNGK